MSKTNSEQLAAMLEQGQKANYHKKMKTKSDKNKKRKCRVCGCTDESACDGGCCWVFPDVCSSCEGALIADARNKFFKNNYALVDGSASGQYLRNRLEKAFINGWEAAKKFARINHEQS